METQKSKMKAPFCGNITGNWQLPCGKFENRSIRRVPLSYLLWWTTTENLRNRHPTTTTAVLHHIAWRIQQKDGVAELLGEGVEECAATSIVPGWDLS